MSAQVASRVQPRSLPHPCRCRCRGSERRAAAAPATGNRRGVAHRRPRAGPAAGARPRRSAPARGIAGGGRPARDRPLARSLGQCPRSGGRRSRPGAADVAGAPHHPALARVEGAVAAIGLPSGEGVVVALCAVLHGPRDRPRGGHRGDLRGVPGASRRHLAEEPDSDLRGDGARLAQGAKRRRQLAAARRHAARPAPLVDPAMVELSALLAAGDRGLVRAAGGPRSPRGRARPGGAPRHRRASRAANPQLCLGIGAARPGPRYDRLAPGPRRDRGLEGGAAVSGRAQRRQDDDSDLRFRQRAEGGRPASSRCRTGSPRPDNGDHAAPRCRQPRPDRDQPHPSAPARRSAAGGRPALPAAHADGSGRPQSAALCRRSASPGGGGDRDPADGADAHRQSGRARSRSEPRSFRRQGGASHCHRTRGREEPRAVRSSFPGGGRGTDRALPDRVSPAVGASRRHRAIPRPGRRRQVDQRPARADLQNRPPPYRDADAPASLPSRRRQALPRRQSRRIRGGAAGPGTSLDQTPPPSSTPGTKPDRRFATSTRPSSSCARAPRMPRALGAPRAGRAHEHDAAPRSGPPLQAADGMAGRRPGALASRADARRSIR